MTEIATYLKREAWSRIMNTRPSKIISLTLFRSSIKDTDRTQIEEKYDPRIPTSTACSVIKLASPSISTLASALNTRSLWLHAGRQRRAVTMGFNLAQKPTFPESRVPSEAFLFPAYIRSADISPIEFSQFEHLRITDA